MKATKEARNDKNKLHICRPEALVLQKESYGNHCTGMLRMPYQRLYSDKQSCVTEIDYTTNLSTEREEKRCLRKAFRHSNLHIHGKRRIAHLYNNRFSATLHHKAGREREWRVNMKRLHKDSTVSTALKHKERLHSLYLWSPWCSSLVEWANSTRKEHYTGPDALWHQGSVFFFSTLIFIFSTPTSMKESLL